MVAGVVTAVTLLAGMQQLGVFNHVDTPAWESEIVRVQQKIWEQDFNLNQMRRAQIQNDLFNNQGQQAQFKLRRQAVPGFYQQQQIQLEDELDAVKKQIDLDQAKIKGQ